MIEFEKELTIAIEASIGAGKAIMSIYNQPEYRKELKEDCSPITEADITSGEIINSFLNKTNYPIISEEIKNIAFYERKSWKFCWIVDPLDGTKEFIKRNGEFTVNIALCENGRPIIGAIYVPVSRELYYANVKNKLAYKTILNGKHELVMELFDKADQINPSQPNLDLIRVVGSRSHMNQNTLDYIESLEKKYNAVEIVSKGSSLKFCLVAEGKADVYPRFAPTMEWDTAAGQAICNAVGLNVISQETNQELDYNKENLLNPFFLVRK